MELKSKQAKKIAEDPVKTAEFAHLIYLKEEQLSIVRKRHGRGFVYFENDKKITDKSQLQRFKDFVIPPAWEDVRISSIENGHLQVVGKDAKGRKQYRYHPHWNQIRNSTKFARMAEFGKSLPGIREAVEKDLRKRTMTKEKCLALVIRLMEETHIRIGSDQYAKENKTFGLSTMRTRHLMTEEGEMEFHFTGKKGKKHKVPLHDKKLRKLVIQCEEIPGWELFQYYDEEGNHHSIDSGMVNEYLKEISEDFFTAKDFRTWAASKIFLETILDFDPAQKESEIEKNIVEACNTAAEKLGNTRTVCRNYYIHPGLIEKYKEGKLEKYIQKKTSSESSDFLEPLEEALLEIIEKHRFQIGEEEKADYCSK